MPKNKKEEIIFALIMVTCMVYVLVVYNVSLDIGFSYNTFLIALKALPLTVLIAFILEHFFIGKVVRKIAFNTIDPKKSESIIIIIFISTLTVMFMCPIMSFIEATIHNGISKELPLICIKTFVLNVPVALLAQLLYVGPIVRKIFKQITKLTR